MRQSQAKADYLVSTANLHMETCDSIPTLRLLDESGTDRVEPLDILPTAHRQMSTYLNIPWKYYDRMCQENIGLLAQNVNTWLQKGPEQRMIRTIDGRARAFLSNRYRRIDNIDIAQITLPIIEAMPDAIYESCNLSDDYMYIKVVNPRLTAEVVPDDIVQAGVVKLASSSMGITDAESDGVLQRLIEGTDYTLYGLANAVTRHSQDVESHDRASKLEEIGYQIITMSPDLFRHINQVTRMAA